MPVVLFGDAFDLRSELPELVVDAFVAAIHVINAIHFGFAIRRKAGKYETRARAQVTGHDRGTAETFDAFDDGAIAFERTVGAEPRHLADVHEPIRENFFRDDADPRRDRHACAHLCL